ncbi:MAG: hypothetical protein ACLUCU_02000 [Slackia sp.]
MDVDRFEAPLLLLRASGPADTWNGIEFVKVLSYAADGEEPLVYEGSLEQGVAGVGGYRGSLAASASGDGIIATEASAGMGNMSVDRVVPDEKTGTLSRTVMHRGTVGEDSACGALASFEQREISWTTADDASLLDALADESRTSTADAADADWAAQANQAGLVSLEGTLHVLDADGVAALQGEQNPNPGYGDDVVYVVLALDAPVSLSALAGDGSGMREGQAAMVSLIPSGGSSGMTLPKWYREDWAALDGAKATIAVSSDKMWWPSDTAFPWASRGRANSSSSHRRAARARPMRDGAARTAALEQDGHATVSYRRGALVCPPRRMRVFLTACRIRMKTSSHPPIASAFSPKGRPPTIMRRSAFSIQVSAD